MGAADRKRGQSVRIIPDKLDLGRSAARFRATGGCVYGCELCRYNVICGGGDVKGGDNGEPTAEGK